MSKSLSFSFAKTKKSKEQTQKFSQLFHFVISLVTKITSALWLFGLKTIIFILCRAKRAIKIRIRRRSFKRNFNTQVHKENQKLLAVFRYNFVVDNNSCLIAGIIICDMKCRREKKQILNEMFLLQNLNRVINICRVKWNETVEKKNRVPFIWMVFDLCLRNMILSNCFELYLE